MVSRYTINEKAKLILYGVLIAKKIDQICFLKFIAKNPRNPTPTDRSVLDGYVKALVDQKFIKKKCKKGKVTLYADLGEAAKELSDNLRLNSIQLYFISPSGKWTKVTTKRKELEILTKFLRHMLTKKEVFDTLNFKNNWIRELIDKSYETSLDHGAPIIQKAHIYWELFPESSCKEVKTNEKATLQFEDKAKYMFEKEIYSSISLTKEWMSN